MRIFWAGIGTVSLAIEIGPIVESVKGCTKTESGSFYSSMSRSFCPRTAPEGNLMRIFGAGKGNDSLNVEIGSSNGPLSWALL